MIFIFIFCLPCFVCLTFWARFVAPCGGRGKGVTMSPFRHIWLCLSRWWPGGRRYATLSLQHRGIILLGPSHFPCLPSHAPVLVLVGLQASHG